MADFSVQDTIGALLNAYTTREQAKIDARLAQSREQQAAYDEAAKSQALAASSQAKADAARAWVMPLVGIAGAGLVLWLVMRK